MFPSYGIAEIMPPFASFELKLGPFRSSLNIEIPEEFCMWWRNLEDRAQNRL